MELEHSNDVSLTSELSLEHLLSSASQSTLGLSLNRAFYDSINQLLAQYPGKVRTFEVTTVMEKIFQQLINKRIDFTIEYPIVTVYLQHNNELNDQVSSVQLSENKAGFLAYIACSRNTGVEKAIAAINLVLQIQTGSVKHLAMVERWLPREMRAPYRKLYQEHFSGK